MQGSQKKGLNTGRTWTTDASKAGQPGQKTPDTQDRTRTGRLGPTVLAFSPLLAPGRHQPILLTDEAPGESERRGEAAWRVSEPVHEGNKSAGQLPAA